MHPPMHLLLMESVSNHFIKFKWDCMWKGEKKTIIKTLCQIHNALWYKSLISIMWYNFPKDGGLNMKVDNEHAPVAITLLVKQWLQNERKSQQRLTVCKSFTKKVIKIYHTSLTFSGTLIKKISNCFFMISYISQLNKPFLCMANRLDSI